MSKTLEELCKEAEQKQMLSNKLHTKEEFQSYTEEKTALVETFFEENGIEANYDLHFSNSSEDDIIIDVEDFDLIMELVNNLKKRG